MECLLRIDTSAGWESSVTKVLASFKDLCYEINPSLGFIYVKGKSDPQLILTKLRKGGKHATIQWISYGFPRDDQNQVHDHESAYNNYMISHDPFSQARYPYENYQLNPPYYPWFNMPLSALPYENHDLEHEPCGHSEGRSSGRSHHPHCHLHSQHHHSAMSSQSGHTQMQSSSLPRIQPETIDQATNQPTSKQSSCMGIIKKLLCSKD
ncbi:hypothetical protein SESBI_00256 [Sesbania bispinosa]|nr:hypothetical protein SESBI_00256 [Sesbania bispinosa]